MSKKFGASNKMENIASSRGASGYNSRRMSPEARKIGFTLLSVLSIAIIGFGLTLVATGRLSFTTVLFALFIYTMIIAMAENLLK